MKNFEDEFMEIQTGLIELCLEATDGDVDKVFAYASIEKKSIMFNAFFEKNGKIVTLNQMNIDENIAWDLLITGTEDLEKIKSLCKENATPTPTEMKMYYDVKNGKYKADYKYEEVCSSKTGISSGEVFDNWYEEVVRNNC